MAMKHLCLCISGRCVPVTVRCGCDARRHFHSSLSALRWEASCGMTLCLELWQTRSGR